MSLLPSPADAKAVAKLEAKTRVAGIMSQIAKTIGRLPAPNEQGRYFVSSYSQDNAPKSLRDSVVELAETDGWIVTWVMRNKAHGNAVELFIRPE